MFVQIDRLAFFLGETRGIVVVVVVYDVVENFVHSGFALQVEGILAFQSVGTDRATNARFWAQLGIADEVEEDANPGIMAR